MRKRSGWPAAPGGGRAAPPTDQGDKPRRRAPKSNARPGRLLRTREGHSALNAMPAFGKARKQNFVYPHYSRLARSRSPRAERIVGIDRRAGGGKAEFFDRFDRRSFHCG